MKILLTGAEGQVGQALQKVYAGSDDDLITADRKQLDITNPVMVADYIQHHHPDALINAAAYTAVDKAEEESVQAYLVNCNGAGFLASACAGIDIPIVHISTDFVFSGNSNRPYTETDETGPLSVYGLSKLAGENAVIASGKKHIILRTSWVFGGAGNFVRTMLRLAETRDEISVVDDQVGGPTAAGDIALAIQQILRRCQVAGFSDWGIYHYSGAPETSWCGLAREIFKHRPGPVINAISTAEYPTAAVRPAWSVLDCSLIKRVFGLNQSDWKKSLAQILS